MCILYATFPGIYAIVAAGVNDAFGPAHYQANFGLLFTQSLAYCAVIMALTKVGDQWSPSLTHIHSLDICNTLPAWIHGNVFSGRRVWGCWSDSRGSGTKTSCLREVQKTI